MPFQIDHIIAAKHHGMTVEENLALSCLPCNARKGTNIAGIDPATDRMSPLFHPRFDGWKDHFHWNGALLVGKTPAGRATVDVLGINASERVEQRRLLIEAGLLEHP